MSFSNLFAKLPCVAEEQSSPNIRNDMTSGQSVSRKRKPQKQPGSDFKRQCVRSNAVNTNEETLEEDAHRHLRPRVSSDRAFHQQGSTDYQHKNKQENGQRYKDFNKGRRGRGAHFTRRQCVRSNAGNSYNETTEEEPSTPGPQRHLRPRVSSDRGFHQQGNTNYQHKKNKGQKKAEYAQRYKDFNKGKRGKSAYSAQPQKRFMTQEFKDHHALEAEGRLICKFFILGRCTKGEECQLEHAEGYNDLIKEACKFYIQESCQKGATCPYMHESIPCKFFHKKGKCHSSENCRFSHEPLTDITQKILDAQIQRDNELSELSRKAEEPPSQSANEEQQANEGIVIPAVRPSFYQSSETAVEVEPSQPHNELQSDTAEKDGAPETENITKSEDSLALNQPGPVCYSVEALLGPQLFKPVLYTATKSQKSSVSPPRSTKATKTESLDDPMDAPYSVANVLRSQSMFNRYLQTPQNVQPGAASVELKERQTVDDKYKVSHLKHHNIQEMFFKQTPSPHVMAESRFHNVHCLKKAPKANNETQKGEITAPNLKLAAEQSTAEGERQHHAATGSSVSQKCKTAKELTMDERGGSGQGSEKFEDMTVFSLGNKKSGSGSLRRKPHEIIQENLETNSEMNMKDQSTSINPNVLQKRQTFDLASPPPHVKNTSRFSNLFATLNSTSSGNICSSNKPILQKSDSGSQKDNQNIKLNPFAREMTINDQSSHTPQNVSKNKPVCEFAPTLLHSQDKSTSKFTNLFASLKSDQTSSANSCTTDKPVSQKSDSGSQKINQDIKPNPFAKTATKAERKTVTIHQKLKTTKEMTINDQSSHTTQNVLKDEQVCEFGDTLHSSVNKTTSSFSDLFANLNSDAQQTLSAGSCSSHKPISPQSNSGSQNVKEEIKPNRFLTKAEKTTATIKQNLKTTREITVNEQSSHTTHTVSKNRQDFESDASLPPPQDKSTSRFINLFASLKSDSDQISIANSCSSDKPVGAQSDSCFQKMRLEKNKTATKAANDRRRHQNVGSSTERTENPPDNFRKSLSFCENGSEVDREDNKGTKGTAIVPTQKVMAVKSISAFQENLQTTRERTMKDQSTRTPQNISENRQDSEFDSSFTFPHNKPTSRFSHLFEKLHSDSHHIFSVSSCSNDNLLTPSRIEKNEDRFNTRDAASERTETEVENGKDDAQTVKAPSTLFQNLFKSLSADVHQTSTVSNPLHNKAVVEHPRKVERSNHNRQKGPQMTKPSPFMEKTLQFKNSSDSSNDAVAGFVTARPETPRSISQQSFTSNLKGEGSQQTTWTPSEFFKSVFATVSAQLEGTSSDCRSFTINPGATCAQNIQRSKHRLASIDRSFTQAIIARQFPRGRTENTEKDDSRVRFVATDPEMSKNSHQMSASSTALNLKSNDNIKSNQGLCEAPLKNSIVRKSSNTSPEPQQCMPQGERRTICSEFINKTTGETQSRVKRLTASASSSCTSDPSPQQQFNKGSGSSRFQTLFRELRRSDQE